MRSHALEQRARLHGAVMVESLRAGGAEDLDTAQQLGGGLRSEALQRSKPAVPDRRLERIDGIDAERLTKEMDLRGWQARHAQQVDEPFGKLGAQLLEVARFAGRVEVADDGECRGSDAGRVGEGAVSVEGGEVVGVECRDGASGLLVRAALELAGALELEV
jgi:hypothetical protein